MNFEITGSEIDIPEYNQSMWINIIKEISNNTDPQFFSCLYTLEKYQRQSKRWGRHQISDYCLYLGNYKQYDLYHHREAHSKMFSNAIVYGKEDNEYIYGPISGSSHCKESFFRLFECGLTTNDWIVDFFKMISYQEWKKKNVHPTVDISITD